MYKAQGRPYLQLVTWAEHQRIRNQKSKYPEYTCDCELLLSNDSKGQQKESSDNKCVRNPIQSESKSESESNTDICSEQKAAAEPPVITLPLNTGEEYPVTQRDAEGWMELYPAVDVMQCLRNMKGWLMSNPAKRKTARGDYALYNNMAAKRTGPSVKGNCRRGSCPLEERGLRC